MKRPGTATIPIREIDLPGGFSRSFQVLKDAAAVAAARLGRRVFLVGGAVRDLVCGSESTAEWDLVVLGGSGEGAVSLARDLAEFWHWRSPVSFDRYGTYLVSSPVGRVEIAQQGKRTGLTPPGSDLLVQDALTRDFTLNALYVDLSEERASMDKVTVFDPTRMGFSDLDSGLLRTPLKAEYTLRDDPLRILRAARFASASLYSVHPVFSRFAKAAAGSLAGVAPERIRDEMNRLLLGRKPSKGLGYLARWGALDVALPEVAVMVGFRQENPYHYPDLFRHTLRVVDRCRPDLVLRWAALLHDCGKPATVVKAGGADRYIGHESIGADLASRLLERLRLGKRTARPAVELVRLHMVHYQNDWSDGTVRRFIRRSGDCLFLLLDLAEADSASLRGGAKRQRDTAKLRIRIAGIMSAAPPARSPLDGRRIMEIIGLKPGPDVGRAKDALTCALTDGIIPPDGESAEKYLVNWWKGRGGRLS